VLNHRPPQIDKALHDRALAQGLLRYCPVCDGYEVTDKRVAVIGSGSHGTREAEFLRGYTKDITLVAPLGQHELDDECRRRLDSAGVGIVAGPCDDFAIDDRQISFTTAEGRQVFDTVYPALGSHIRSELAVEAGAKASADGCLEVDAHQETSIPGLFAAGDVVKGLDQISHAMGEGGVAATAIRNHLAKEKPIRR
jgi:thioredoxin reductase (NADPH)